MTLTIREVLDLDTATRQLLADLHERSATTAYAHIFPDPFPREETQHRWNTYSGHVALALHDDRPIGFIAWHDHEVDALYVLPEAAGHGAGGHLMDAAVDTSTLWVLEDNTHARGFYTHRGWIPSGRVRQQYGEVRELEYLLEGI